jgi:hypothetical protein
MHDGQRAHPLIGIRYTEQGIYPADGFGVPVASGFQQGQPVRRETRRIIRREVHADDGRSGVELTEELEIHYAAPRAPQRQEADPVRAALAGIVSFIGICLMFTALGGSSQSMASMPVYWLAFFFLWWLLA